MPPIRKSKRNCDWGCRPSDASSACTCGGGNGLKQEGERRNIFLRYLGEVAAAVSEINGADRDGLYARLLEVAKKKTAEADSRFDDRGRRVEEDAEDYGDNVLIVEQKPEDVVDQ